MKNVTLVLIIGMIICIIINAILLLICTSVYCQTMDVALSNLGAEIKMGLSSIEITVPL